MTQITFRYKGSSKSGNHGHAGRLGLVGGSAPKSVNIIHADLSDVSFNTNVIGEFSGRIVLNGLYEEEQARTAVLKNIDALDLFGITGKDDVQNLIISNVSHKFGSTTFVDVRGKISATRLASEQDIKSIVDGSPELLNAVIEAMPTKQELLYVKRITDKVPEGVKLENGLLVTADGSGGAFWRESEGLLVIAPAWNNARAIAHELAHASDQALRNDTKVRKAFERAQSATNIDLSGLRANSLLNIREFIADATAVSKLGDSYQRRHLRELFEGNPSAILGAKELTISFRYKGSSKSGNHGHAGRQGLVGGSAPQSFKYPVGGIGTPVDIDNYRIAGKTGAEWRKDQEAITAAGHDALLADISLNFPNVTEQQAQEYVERLDAHRGMVFEEALLTAQGYNLTRDEQKMLIENVINHDVDKYTGEQSAPYMTRHDDRKMWWEAMGKHHENNPHHPEYWQINDKRAEQMSTVDFIEMIGDWKGTAKYFKTEKDAYYRQNGGSMVLHPETRAAAERELGIKHTPFPKNYPEGHFKTYERKLDKDREALQGYLQRLKPGAAPVLKADMERMISWIDKIKRTEGDGYGLPFLAGIDHVFSTINKFDRPRHKELTIQFRVKGSSKSGNHGHAGILGKRGGSAPRKAALVDTTASFKVDEKESAKKVAVTVASEIGGKAGNTFVTSNDKIGVVKKRLEDSGWQKYPDSPKVACVYSKTIDNRTYRASTFADRTFGTTQIEITDITHWRVGTDGSIAGRTQDYNDWARGTWNKQ